MQLITRPNRQRGLTLIEIMIGLSISIVIVGGAIVVYTSSVQNSNDTLKSSRLNQEVAGVMLVISNDLRRAGYWETPLAGNFNENPFSQPNATAVTVIDDLSSDTAQAANGQGTCITYSYDATYLAGNTPGVVDTTDLFGFRLNNGAVQMRQSGTVDGTECVGGTCSSCQNGTWADVTDPNVVEVTNLTFDLAASDCLNVAEPDLVDDNGDGTIDDDAEFDCYTNVPPAGSGDITAESREVLVSITARLAGDVETQASAVQTVLVRNDMIRIR